jgi:anti-sigma B factor antagonist
MTLFYLSEEAHDENTHVVTAGGNLDFAAAPDLRRCVNQRLDAGTRNLILDFSNVEFIDSTAIGVAVGALKRLRDSGGSLLVVCHEPNVCRIFDVVGLAEVLPLHATREDAVGALLDAA